MKKKQVLIFNEFYLPGVKGGGPIRSIENIVNNLFKNIDFYILTSNRDFGDSQPYNNITMNQWIRVGNANVMYIDKNKLNKKKVLVIMKYKNFDYYYLNSFFNYKFSILPLITKAKNKSVLRGQIILAPRGEFSPGALKLKRLKKVIYINIFKKVINYKKIVWQATGNGEKEHINSIFQKEINVKNAKNLTSDYKKMEFNKKLVKISGEVKFIFVSRIHPKKNLLDALNFISILDGNITFDIYGPIEDEKYWKKCSEFIKTLPSNIQVNYGGIISHTDVIGLFNKYHFFLFPTLGENFGHVISEAFIGSCPVIISDQTPWLDLEKINVGWDISLDSKQKFIDVIVKCIHMENDEYQEMAMSAFDYGIEKSMDLDSLVATKKLFS